MAYAYYELSLFVSLAHLCLCSSFAYFTEVSGAQLDSLAFLDFNCCGSHPEYICIEHHYHDDDSSSACGSYGNQDKIGLTRPASQRAKRARLLADDRHG